VTPQYNWSIPGALKVAIDHLFHEWGGKPMFMVTYGARGGGKAAGHLRDIWTG
jgi:NAD(P)H-dependent FMN reductase